MLALFGDGGVCDASSIMRCFAHAFSNHHTKVYIRQHVRVSKGFNERALKTQEHMQYNGTIGRWPLRLSPGFKESSLSLNPAPCSSGLNSITCASVIVCCSFFFNLIVSLPRPPPSLPKTPPSADCLVQSRSVITQPNKRADSRSFFFPSFH